MARLSLGWRVRRRSRDTPRSEDTCFNAVGTTLLFCSSHTHRHGGFFYGRNNKTNFCAKRHQQKLSCHYTPSTTPADLWDFHHWRNRLNGELYQSVRRRLVEERLTTPSEEDLRIRRTDINRTNISVGTSALMRHLKKSASLCLQLFILD